jgi:hypothetical protein
MSSWASAAERHGLRSRSIAEEAVMQNQPNRPYNSDDLAMLTRVLEEALIVSIDGRGLSVPAIQELISRIGNLIMDRFTAGETDPEKLKAIAVESIQRRLLAIPHRSAPPPASVTC